MGRYRSRSRSYSPRRRSRTPPRGRKRYDDDPRDRHRSHRDRRSPAPSGLLIRNLPLDARTEDLKVPFERYGPVKDVYLPKNYYTGEPRGFGFVKFRYAEDAAEAKHRMNHQVIGGREIRIVFAEENRKTPQEMRMSSRGSGRNRRTSPRSPRHRYHSYSRSPSPARHDSRERCLRDDYRSPMQSRSISHDRRMGYDRFPNRSRSISRDRGAKDGYHSPTRSRSRSLSPSSPYGDKEFSSKKRSLTRKENGKSSPKRDSLGHPRSRSRSFSPR